MNTQELQIAKDLYLKGESLTGIHRVLGYSTNTIKRYLLQDGVAIRTRKEQNKIVSQQRVVNINENYFDNIGVNQAWLMGFIASDGTIRKDSNEIKIGLSSVDREILEKIKEEIQSPRKITDYTTQNGYAVSEFRWSCAKHKDFLSKYGIVNRKTYLPMYVPNFEKKELVLAFILGYFDGDGAISISKDGYLRFRIVSHRDEILNSIVQNLIKFYPTLNYSLSKDKRGLYELSISTTFAVSIFQDMYDLNSLRLDRKYQKFLEYNKTKRLRHLEEKDEEVC